MSKKNSSILLFFLVAFSIYCCLTIGETWDEKDNLLRGKITLDYLFSLGKFDKAKKYLEDSIIINPNFTEAHRLLSRLTKYNKDNDHFTKLEKLYESFINDNSKDEMNLAFALGKAYEDIRNYEKSFFFNCISTISPMQGGDTCPS